MTSKDSAKRDGGSPALGLEVRAAIREGSRLDDLDAAVGCVQDVMGVRTGDVAGVWFTGMGHDDGHADEQAWWASLDERERAEALEAYAAHEALHAEDEAGA